MKWNTRYNINKHFKLLNPMKRQYYAHSLEGKPVNDWHIIEEHLENTAKLASEFAKAFNSDKWAYLTGLWHDLGKYINHTKNKEGK